MRRKYPLPELPVGGEFIAVNPPKNFAKYVWMRGQALGKRFSTKSVPDGVRVRRVA